MNKNSGDIDVLNVNLKEKAEDYLSLKNVCPAYHMNKKLWVSVMLDESLDDDVIVEMIKISYSNSELNKKHNKSLSDIL